MAEQNLNLKTIALIDSLKSTTGAYGLANNGSEYKIITEIFLYKFFNDKFGYEAKRAPEYGARLKKAEKWDAEYDFFTEDEVEDLFTYLPGSVPRLKPHQTLAHLYNASGQGDFSALLDSTLIEIASQNADTFSVSTSGKSKVSIFTAVTTYVTDTSKRDAFAKALMSTVTSFNFETVFDEKYDFFSGVFEYLIKDYNNAGGGKYAEYFTPRAIAQVMAALLTEEGKDYKGVTCYDPSAGTGTLLMALAHAIGEDRCSIYSQDISEKSSEMLRLNLILNNLVGSLPNIIQGNTLTEPAHKESDGRLKTFDFVVSNPPFKLDFPEYSDSLTADSMRFWAGVPNKVKNIDPKKPKMAIYTCFIQHVINSLKPTGRGAIVVPTGFITAKSGVEKRILERIVNDHVICGVVSMPSNVFATTGTNVSVLIFDRTPKTDDDTVVLIDASKLGEEYKEGNNQKRRLRPEEVKKIVDTFRSKKIVEDFSVVKKYKDIKEKNCSLSAGQYFDIKIEYVDITQEEFNKRIAEKKETLKNLFKESADLGREILKSLDSLEFHEEVK
ncbi:class I SAM-dependent DNA methyltransferase [Treponema sp. Marseille-Q4132]|uniref:HsdM family class I SAM-dependent methyltransferase n=1 Tax=Treponema sp. Marseille-Q4132 TaxID=2766701 RepID=UPI00165312CD|nr:class I SAM-dependent DNA methyltransferase [Treponema sp. Marseille-Q4132]QNL96274.1 SAM-dependent DNA methyltransferase [Treponema sp. Marseille-Q4132]